MKLGKFNNLVLLLLTFVFCVGCKPAILNGVVKAINGDNTMLTVLIIGVIILGGSWLYSQIKDKWW